MFAYDQYEVSQNALDLTFKSLFRSVSRELYSSKGQIEKTACWWKQKKHPAPK